MFSDYTGGISPGCPNCNKGDAMNVGVMMTDEDLEIEEEIREDKLDEEVLEMDGF